MAGKRTKDITASQTSFNKDLVLLVDKIDTGSGDWLTARKLELGLLGNTYMQGSSNGINWHDDILSTDTYFRYSTDGGNTWRTLNTDLVREGIENLYFKEYRVLATPGIQDAVDNQHTHNNKTVLDNIINSGDGTAFLTNDGTYKTASEAIPALIGLTEKSSDPADPAEGKSVIWQSDGTETGDDGDILIKITAGGVTKTTTLVDFSAV
jgi:hypothetical protein